MTSVLRYHKDTSGSSPKQNWAPSLSLPHPSKPVLLPIFCILGNKCHPSRCTNLIVILHTFPPVTSPLPHPVGFTLPMYILQPQFISIFTCMTTSVVQVIIIPHLDCYTNLPTGLPACTLTSSTVLHTAARDLCKIKI